MKPLFYIFLFIFTTLLTPLKGQFLSQNSINDKGVLTLHSSCDNSLSPTQIYQETLNWIADNSSKLGTDLTYHSSQKGEIVVKGHQHIYLSKSPSAYKTELFYTLHITIYKTQTTATIKDIYYRSIPLYGKQGTPSLLTYTSDWFSRDRFYKRDGSERWLNVIYKNNTITTGQQLLASLHQRWQPTPHNKQ